MAIFEEYEEVFKKGAIVEVSSEDEGLRGSWYTATVIRTLSRKTNKMLVEYHNLMSDDSPTRPLREFVHAVLVRPIAPRDPPSRRFRPMDDVDAFHNDGWWEGVVTSVIEGPPLRYAVFFRCSREQIEFSASDLRLHREWLRANHWLPPLHPSLPPCQKIKNGDDRGERRQGSHSGDRDGVTGNGEVNDVGRGNCIVLNKQDEVAKKGSRKVKRLTSNGSGNQDAVKKKRKVREQRRGSKGISSKPRVKRNVKVKEPRKRASNHAGCQQSKK